MIKTIAKLTPFVREKYCEPDPISENAGQDKLLIDIKHEDLQKRVLAVKKFFGVLK